MTFVPVQRLRLFRLHERARTWALSLGLEGKELRSAASAAYKQWAGRLPPGTRGDCVAGTEVTGSQEERTNGVRQCGAFLCRSNLLWTPSENVPGRRHNGLAPPGTLSGCNTSAGAPSCALDVVDANPHGLSSGEVARIYGISKRDVELVVAKAMKDQGAVRLMKLHSGVMDNLEGE